MEKIRYQLHEKYRISELVKMNQYTIPGIYLWSGVAPSFTLKHRSVPRFPSCGAYTFHVKVLISPAILILYRSIYRGFLDEFMTVRAEDGSPITLERHFARYRYHVVYTHVQGDFPEICPSKD